VFSSVSLAHGVLLGVARAQALELGDDLAAENRVLETS
jgi:hypothetical protein